MLFLCGTRFSLCQRPWLRYKAVGCRQWALTFVSTELEAKNQLLASREPTSCVKRLLCVGESAEVRVYNQVTANKMAKKLSVVEEQKVLIARDELRAFCMRGLQKAGAAEAHARALADVIVAADYRGHFSHGLNRLEYYMKDLLTSQVASLGQEPEVVKETVATALVDGHNLLGPLVGQFSMDLAIKKAKEAGIGWVSVKGSNHFGIAGWYAVQAQEQGLLGMAFTNTSPMLVPTRARQTTLGTNPISLAAPANHGDSMVLDMATTVVAAGKVEVKKTLNQDIPLGWGVNNKGKMTTEADTVLGKNTGGLMPLGGPEETSGYKGFGLAMMVEVFCGILSGSNYGPHIRHWTQHHGAADLGQCFVAIDPEAFAPGFRDRMSDLLDHCRNLQPAEGETEVLVPGDPERKHMAMCDARGGIPFQLKQIQWADDIAKKYDFEPMQRLQV